MSAKFTIKHSQESIDKRRQHLAKMLFLGNAVLFAMRVNLSVAIVAMVGKRKEPLLLNSSPQLENDTCPILNNNFNEVKELPVPKGEFDWEEQVQGKILGSFFWGYILTNLIGGRLAERYGGKVVYGSATFITALLTLMTPLAARHSSESFMLIRMMQGMSQGGIFPSQNVLMSNWVPSDMKASFTSHALSGVQVGIVVTWIVSGAICESYLGWPYVFYSFGAIALLFCLVWFKTITDYPTNSSGKSMTRKLYPVPWRAILTSRPFQCLVVAHFTAGWGFYCLLAEMPTYLANILHFDIHTNGMVSSLPYLCKWILMIVYSSWIDRRVRRGQMTLKTARKMSTVLSFFVPGLFLAAIQLVGCQRELVVLLLILAVTVTGTDTSGFLCQFQEMAPNFAGTLTGLSTSVATTTGFLAPQLIGYITSGNQTLTAWRYVFLLMTAIYTFGSAIYLIFMSAEVQPWNKPTSERKIPYDEVI